MNKAELINEIHAGAGINKSQAAAALDTILESISKALKGGDSVTLVGFGTFSVASRGARTGRNPRTGDSLKIAAKSVAKFKPGKKLSDAVNSKAAKKKK